MKHLAKVMSLAVALAMTAEMVPQAAAQTRPPPAQQQTQGQQPQAQQKQNDHSRAKGGPKHAH